MSMSRICHVTSAHNIEDDRIFLKECTSLSRGGYDVYLVERGDTYDKEGVHLIGIGIVSCNPIKRMVKDARKAYNKALSLNADIYHLHDPELLLYALKLKKKGKLVIFDSHEDVPAQIIDKTWIPKLFRYLISDIYKKYESYVIKRLDAVVAATPHIAEQFKGRAKKVVVINNFPRLDDICFHDKPFSERDAIVCYAGGIDELRGESVMIEAMKGVNGKLKIAGEHKIMELPEAGVSYLGQLDRKGINALYGNSIVGLCVLKPIKNYFYSQPIKMYEYMAAGIPFICSKFPLWERVVRDSGAGVCVDPLDSKMLSKSINDLLDDRQKAQKMGENGYRYVINHSNWGGEEKKLLKLYEDLEKAYVSSGRL